MLFLGRSSCGDLKCNYNQKKRLLDRPVPRRFFVHSFAPSLVLFTVHMPLILPLSVFSRKTLSPLFDKSHPVCLFSCFFSVSRKSRRSEITKRADIWSLCVFSRWNVEGICFNWRFDLAAAKIYFSVCHRDNLDKCSIFSNTIQESIDLRRYDYDSLSQNDYLWFLFTRQWFYFNTMQGILSNTMLVDIFKVTNICSCFSVSVDLDDNHKVKMIISQALCVKDWWRSRKGGEMNKDLFAGALGS